MIPIVFEFMVRHCVTGAVVSVRQRGYGANFLFAENSKPRAIRNVVRINDK
jgi:hypothetical protein